MKILILLLPLFIISGCYAYGTQDIIKCLVDDKERVTTRSGESLSSKYLVYCDTETLENTDSIFYFKFNSSDVYRKLKRGQEYDLKVFGLRIGLFSSYRNIIRIEGGE